jgi:hypothetical protein
MLRALLRSSPDFSALNFIPSARLRNPVPTFEITPAARSHAMPLTFLSRMASKPEATSNNGMTKLTNLHHVCRSASVIVHFSLRMLWSTVLHRNRKMPRLTVGSTQKSRVFAEGALSHLETIVEMREERPSRSHVTHQPTIVLARMKRPNLRYAAQTLFCSASWLWSAAHRKQSVRTMGRNRRTAGISKGLTNVAGMSSSN